MEKPSEEYQELLQATLNNSLSIIHVFEAVRNEQGQIIDFTWLINTATAEARFGALKGQSLLQRQPVVLQTGVFDHFVQVTESGLPLQYEKQYVHEQFDGWFHQSVVKVNDGVATSTLDITDRKRYEAERERHYLLLQQAELLAGTGTWDYDLLTRSFTWSEGMYRLFNLEKGIKIRPDIYLQYATVDCQEQAKRHVAQIEKGETELEETLRINLGETVRVLKIKATVIKNEQGHPLRVLGVNMDVTVSIAAEEQLRQMAVEQQLEIFRVILRTQEEERRRISESLHNGLGQILFGTRISMNHLSRSLALADPTNYDKSKEYTEKLLKTAILESRNISHELMPATLEGFGLAAAVDDVCKQLSGEVKFYCQYSGLHLRLENYLELAIFRTVQELMLNVVKHAGATEAQVIIALLPDHIEIKVSDNGRGIRERQKAHAGIGLSSIHSKIKLLSGTVDVVSRPGKGTEIFVHIPHKF